MNYRQHIAIIYLIVIVLAVAVSSVIFVNNQDSQDTHQYLFKKTLPLLQKIRLLQEAKTEYERLLYEYYATTDRVRLLPKLEAIDAAIYKQSADISRLKVADPAMQTVMQLHQTMKTEAAELDRNLSGTGIDWDLARTQLMHISSAGEAMNPHLALLTKEIEEEAESGSMSSLENNQTGSQLVIAFSVIITGLALFIGYFVDRYLREAAERRRISMFAERNPNPVISSNDKGEITYANPSSEHLLQDLHINQGDWASFLPKGFQERITEAFKSGPRQTSGEYSVDERTFKYSLSALKDLDTAHIYFEDITDKVAAQERLNFQANHDSLTKLPNRFSLESKLNEVLDQKDQPHMELLLINLHRFDRITSIYGYQFGDAIIRHFARQLCEQIHPYQEDLLENQAFRIDGTTFALVINNEQEHKAISDAILTINETAIHEKGNDFYLSLRLGSSNFPRDGESLDELMKCADAALLQAKKEEGPPIRRYNASIHKTELRLAEIEQQMRLSTEELTLYYQPKIHSETQSICGAEALMRWIGDDGFRYFPDEFIPVAEQSGLIIPIGEQAIQTGIDRLLNWNPGRDFKLAINLSGAQFQHPDFMPRLKEMIAPHPGIEQGLEFEITESMLMNDLAHSIEIMKQLKDIGFQLSIDDFGTGYSSLSYLKDFPIDKLKIDRSFVMNLETHEDDQTMVRSIIYLAHALGLKVVAEGVETKEQFEYLKSLECEEIQGYYFSRPLAETDFKQQYLS